MWAACDGGVHQERGAPAWARPADPCSVCEVPEAPRDRPFAGSVVHEPAGHQQDDPGCRACDGLARVRWCRPVDAAGAPDRNPLRFAAQVVTRQRRNRFRAARDLVAGRLDRARAPVRRRLSARLDTQRRLLRFHQPGRVRDLRRPDPVGLSPDPALDHVRAPLLCDLRPDDPGERDGHVR